MKRITIEGVLNHEFLRGAEDCKEEWLRQMKEFYKGDSERGSFHTDSDIKAGEDEYGGIRTPVLVFDVDGE